MSRIQIEKFQNDKRLVEFIDKVQSGASEQNMTFHHRRFSKIGVVALDYSKGTGENTVIAEVNLDIDVVKLLCNRLLERGLEGNDLIWREQKIISAKQNDEGESFVTMFELQYNPNMNIKYALVLVNGWGKAEATRTGGIKLRPGTFRKEREVKVFLQRDDLIKLFASVRDYINAKEIYLVRELMVESAKRVNHPPLRLTP